MTAGSGWKKDIGRAEQVAKNEKRNPCFKARHVESSRTGNCSASGRAWRIQALRMLAGNFPAIERWERTVINRPIFRWPHHPEALRRLLRSCAGHAAPGLSGPGVSHAYEQTMLGAGNYPNTRMRASMGACSFSFGGFAGAPKGIWAISFQSSGRLHAFSTSAWISSA
jgi:hypothetical protein